MISAVSQAICAVVATQPTNPPLAKIRPGSPAPTMGPGTGDDVRSVKVAELTVRKAHGTPGHVPVWKELGRVNLSKATFVFCKSRGGIETTKAIRFAR